MNNSQKIWKAKLKELTTIVDNEGIPIDKDILETVAAFNLNGFPTIKSCAGHFQQSSLRFPFVLGWATGKPESRFINDKKLRQKIALKYSGPQEEIEIDPGAAEEYYKIVKKRRLNETKEYKAWDKKNRVLRKAILSLLQQFYSRRTVSQDAKIYLAKGMLGYLVMTGKMKIKKMIRDNTVKPSEIPQIQKNIIAGQKEMRTFTEFLKKTII
jgi:hypothetical protein